MQVLAIDSHYFLKYNVVYRTTKIYIRKDEQMLVIFLGWG